MVWLSAMACAIVLGAATPDGRGQRLRVALAMLAGLPLALLWQNPWLYFAIDAVIAAVIMLEPKTVWQRIIGACYSIMALVTVGYIVSLYISSSAAGSPDMLSKAHDWLGWAATLVLILWGASGVCRGYTDNRGAVHSAPVVEPRRVQ